MFAATLIREARSRSGLGLRELARRAGTSHGTLSRYERGEVTPRTDTLERIVAACGYEMHVRLAPPDQSHQRLEQTLANMSPSERLASLRNLDRLRGLATTGTRTGAHQ